MDTRPNDESVSAAVEHIGRRIAGARAEARLTQAEVAKLANVSPVRVSAIETGREMIRVDTLAKIAGAVGLRVTLEQVAA